MSPVKAKYRTIIDKVEVKQLKHDRDITLNNMEVEFSLMALERACETEGPLTSGERTMYNRHFKVLEEALNKMEAKNELQ